MDKYVALIGKEHRTALNSLWAVLKQERFEPDELFLVLDEEKELSDELKKDFNRLLKNYDIDCSVKSDLFSDIKDVRRLIGTHEDGGNGSVALDISSGSKLTTAKILMDRTSHMFDHVFYLEIESEGDKRSPLPAIEKNRIRLRDLKSEQKEAI